MSGKISMNILLYIASAMFGVMITSVVLIPLFLRPIDASDNADRPFLMERGWGLKELCVALEQQGMTRAWWSTYFLARLQGTSLVEENKLKVRAGEYSLKRSMTATEMLNKLKRGEILYHKITIPEGARLTEIVTALAKTGIVTAEELEAVVRDPAFILKLGVQGGSLEGYLFPETYQFTRPDNAAYMITTMVETAKKSFFTEDYRKRAESLGMSLGDLISLASIIEKETGSKADRKKISSVFHNRLKIGMPLQSDPTVIYGLPNFDGNLTKQHLLSPSPYNTYIRTGLTPTPICSPGLEAFQAALFPDDTDYLYFVATGDSEGTSYFSATYKEHQAAVRRYQLKQ